MRHKIKFQNSGYAALTITLITMSVSLIILGGLSFFALQEVTINRNFIKSIEAKNAAESGVEDAIYRIFSDKQMGDSETIGVGTATTTVTSVVNGNARTIRSEGKRAENQQNLEVTLQTSIDAINFYYGVQVGEGGLKMDANSSITGNAFSNGSIIGDNGAKITGDAVVAAGIAATPSVEWTAHNANNNFATSSSNRDIAQSFTANATGAINKISVYLGKTGTPSDITLRIANDDGGNPDDSDIANTTIPASSVGVSPSWIDSFFSAPPNINANSKYWIVLDYNTNSSSNYWNWRKDTSDGYVNNTGKSTTNWSSGSAVWTNVGGDLPFRAWIGGVSNKIDNVTIGTATTGVAYADMFINTAVHGSSCPNQYCITNQPQSPQSMPISDGIIQDFKDEAAAGGVINGDYNVVADSNLGPKKITGNLLIKDNNKTLTVTGTIYVQGNIDIDNGSTIKCSPAYNTNTCIILNDGWIHTKNNGAFSGSGQAGSFVMLLSTLSCDGSNDTSPDGKSCGHHEGSIDLHNNAAGAIFYAAHGLLNMHNGVAITEAVAYKLHLDQNANVTYTQGLADVNFSSGPGGGYAITSWKEVE